VQGELTTKSKNILRQCEKQARVFGFDSFDGYFTSRLNKPLKEIAAELGVNNARFSVFCSEYCAWIRRSTANAFSFEDFKALFGVHRGSTSRIRTVSEEGG